jgi:hypothetical protein
MNTTPRFSARIALATLVTLSTTALAENFFSKKPVWSSGTTVSGGDGIARFVDYDRDGDMDFLTSASDPQRWVIYQNNDGKIANSPIWESDETSDLNHIEREIGGHR